MSREIKFRVWDKDMKKMHTCGENVHDSIDFLENTACYYNLQNGCGSMPDGSGTYELMQYTGLKDKNGVDIWEFDLLKDEENFIWEVVFENGSFRVRCDDLLAVRLLNVWNKACCVVGNVFQNPELIQGD
ncbi:YopX family protein [Bacillus sp. REN10]|uniref:YopX family protein n=1 Tax=Bacillus sp. REN10 TaxID=2782541 RepID=UPI00193C2AA8|nr:YopX family protein [Bacillus sp. REN10]